MLEGLDSVACTLSELGGSKMLDADNCEEAVIASQGLLAQPRLSLSLRCLGVRSWPVEKERDIHPFVATPRSPGKELRSHKVAQ